MSTTKGPPGTVPKATPPNQTLYVQNLNDKLQKSDLKRNLYMLFASYGVVLDVIALKTTKMRGQAHIVFRDADASTQAMRALQGYEFFGKKMVISYAKGRSETIKKLTGEFQLPTKEAPTEPATEPSSVQAEVFGNASAPMKAKPVNAAATEEAKGMKRGRDEESAEEDEDDEAMDVSDSD